MRRIRFIVHLSVSRTRPSARASGAASFRPRRRSKASISTGSARLNIPGGIIRNIATHAAFLAAGTDEPIRMVHLLRATRAEYSKLEKPLTAAELGGWT